MRIYKKRPARNKFDIFLESLTIFDLYTHEKLPDVFSLWYSRGSFKRMTKPNSHSAYIMFNTHYLCILIYLKQSIYLFIRNQHYTIFNINVCIYCILPDLANFQYNWKELLKYIPSSCCYPKLTSS